MLQLLSETYQIIERRHEWSRLTIDDGHSRPFQLVTTITAHDTRHDL